MRFFGYTDMVSHIAQHRKFIDFLRLSQVESKRGDAMATVTLIQDLKIWLLSHIATEDRKIALALQSRLVELSDYTKKMHHTGEVMVSVKQIKLYKAVIGQSGESFT